MLSYLTATLGKSSEEVTALLFKTADDGTLTDEISETALESLEAAFQSHLEAAPKDALKAEFDRGHNAGKFEALSKAEEELRKTYALEGKGKIKDLVLEAVAKAAKAESSDDKVLTHPAFVARAQEYEAKIEQLNAEWEGKVGEATSKAERTMRFTSILPTLDAALLAAGVSQESLKPSAKKAFLAQFEGKDFEVRETGVFIKNPDGSLMKDKNGHPIKLEQFVATDAPNWFAIEKQPARHAPGNDPAQPAQGKATTWNKSNLPKSEQEFHAAYYTVPEPDKAEFYKAYMDSRQEG